MSAAEVAELGVPCGVVEHIGRLDVAMDDAVLVRGAEGGQEVEGQPPPCRRRQRTARRQALGEGPRRHELEDEQPRRRLGVVQGDDVRVAQAAGCLGLAREAEVGLALGLAPRPPEGEELERDRDAEQEIDGLVDPPHGAGGEAERQAYLRFAREAEAAGRLRHPNIVALHDAQPASGLFVFELMAAGTLAERLAAGGPLSPAAGRRLALDLLAALGAAHEHGIVHRDVKPANVLYDAAGNAKLGDFGGAHLADFGQTQTGGFLGTLAYMSPEQITGAPIGFSADLYALGATLFEALTGRPPFLGPDLVAQHLGEAPPAASALRPALGWAHDEVLGRALAKAPEERFTSAAEMAHAIAAWPLEAAVDPTGGASAPASALGAQPVAEALRAGDGVGVEERELWRADDARVVLRYDRRTERHVLVEERAAPLDDAALARVRSLAAAGGPFVQRVLGLDVDRRAISYESIDGEARPLAALTPAERAELAAPLAALPPGATRTFARTPAGPVLLIVAPPEDD